MKKITTKNIALSAIFIAIGIVLPIFFHSVNILAKMFLPMHIPVILCAMICGPFLGCICAIATVLLSSSFTGMPVIYPMAIIMCFELATYALISGNLYNLLIKKFNIIFSSYIALIIAMISGRIVLGVASLLLIGILGNGYTFQAFLSGAFITAFPGIIIQLVLIPWILFLFDKTNLIKSKKNYG